MPPVPQRRSNPTLHWPGGGAWGNRDSVERTFVGRLAYGRVFVGRMPYTWGMTNVCS